VQLDFLDELQVKKITFRKQRKKSKRVSLQIELTCRKAALASMAPPDE